MLSPDAGNVNSLAHPPFTFTGINWEKGDLKAIGYNGGKIVAEHIVSTPEELTAIELSYFESGTLASTDDLLIIYVRLNDENGTLIFDENEKNVRLEVIEGGTVIGPSSVKAEAGLASFIVKTDCSEKLKLKAFCGNLEAKKVMKLIE